MGSLDMSRNQNGISIRFLSRSSKFPIESPPCRVEVLLSDVLALPASSKLQLADELAVAVAAAAAAGLSLGLGVLLALSLILIRLKSPLFGVIVRSFSSALRGSSIE